MGRSLTGPEMMVVVQDIADACDLLTQADKTRQALPNRVLYDITTEFSRARSGHIHQQIDFNGALQHAAFNLANAFNQHGYWEDRQAVAFFNTLDSNLQAAGISFAPKYQGWLNVRKTP